MQPQAQSEWSVQGISQLNPTAAYDPHVVELTRTVRLAVRQHWTISDARSRPRWNSYAGWPAAIGAGCWCEFDVSCRGVPDVETGYLINIKQIDDAVRDCALEWLLTALNQPGEAPPDLHGLLGRIEARLPLSVRRLRWRPTPFLSISAEVHPMPHVLLTHCFEFSAAHRLHVPEFSEAQNQAIFGKCNNPNGHGHNYQVEVTVRLQTTAGNSSLEGLERTVWREVIERFDHKHLNLDTEEFKALNPSVENIAMVCHGLLEKPLRAAGVELRNVRIWETEKTSAIFPAD